MSDMANKMYAPTMSDSSIEGRIVEAGHLEAAWDFLSFEDLAIIVSNFDQPAGYDANIEQQEAYPFDVGTDGL